MKKLLIGLAIMGAIALLRGHGGVGKQVHFGESTQETATRLADKTNAQLPKMVDDIMRWDKVEVQGDHVTFTYTATMSAVADGDKDKLNAAIRADIVPAACHERNTDTILGARTMLDAGMQVTVVIRDTERIELTHTDITKDDCKGA